MVSPEASASSFASYSKESMEWVQKRVSLLSEEMQMAEAHMEQMRHKVCLAQVSRRKTGEVEE